MEERKMNVIFGKDGRGAVNTKIALPITWVRRLGASPENREVIMKYDEKSNQIIIKKK